MWAGPWSVTCSTILRPTNGLAHCLGPFRADPSPSMTTSWDLKAHARSKTHILCLLSTNGAAQPLGVVWALRKLIYFRSCFGWTYPMCFNYVFARPLMLSMASKHDVQIQRVHWESFLTMVVLFPSVFSIWSIKWFNIIFNHLANISQVVMHLDVR